MSGFLAFGMTTLAHSTDGKTLSYWHETSEARNYPPLGAPATTDVCVIGAGIAGLTSAYLLLKEGKKVIVLDDSAIGDGQTGRTSAHLASAIDDRFHELERMLGEDAAKLAYHSHSSAIDLIEQISKAEGIDCDFVRVDGYLWLHPSDKPETLDHEYEAALKAGAAVERVGKIPIGSFDSGPALRFARQGRFHPGKYLNGLCRAIEKMGGVIHCGTFVKDTQGADLEKGEFCQSEDAGKHVVSSRAVVVATNTPTPINDWTGIYTKQASYRTYVITAKVPKGSVTDALYWDTGDLHRRSEPYHYIRIEPKDDHDLLIVGGEDHKTGQHDESPTPFETLEQWTRKHFPQAKEVVHRWSGQVQEPADGIAYIGVAPTAKPNVYVITGDSGMGLTHATLGAKLVTDLIMKRANPWAELYDPSRKATSNVLDFAKENLNAAKTLKEYVTPGDVKTEDEVAPGQGALMRSGLKKIAVYRDDAGKVHKISSVCTHLGCVVQWNPIEKTWDCPCHGSRFKCTGEVVMGPAIDGLKPTE